MYDLSKVVVTSSPHIKAADDTRSLMADVCLALLPALVVFAAFCAFLLIEAQARYAYLPQLFIFLAAASGLDRLGKEKENAQNLDRRPLL